MKSKNSHIKIYNFDKSTIKTKTKYHLSKYCSRIVLMKVKQSGNTLRYGHQKTYDRNILAEE